MKLYSLRIKNFRGFSGEAVISFNDLTVLIGKNDSGKSTILDALDAFFNENIEKEDFCVYSSENENIVISCTFSDLPDELIIDSSYKTQLCNEFLTREDGLLEIVKEFSCSTQKPKIKEQYLIAYCPSAENTNDLYELKIADLRKRAEAIGVNLSEANRGISSKIRHAIWSQIGNLELKEQHVNLQGPNFGKSIYEQIKNYLPIYALFKSDRPSTDQDQEAQDPMKTAIKGTLSQHLQKLEEIEQSIEQDLKQIVSKTVAKIKEMDPALADQLNPQIKHKNWDSLFSVSLTDDDQVPINKRGSGTRRLILLNFFRARAEQDSISQDIGTIYAIEEPETSQHPDHQKMLINAFQEMVSHGNCQVILTTHTPNLVRRIDQSNIRYVENYHHQILIRMVDETTRKKIKASLGILPDHDVKVFWGVEGKNDIDFLRTISKILASNESDIPNIENEEANGRLVFIPLGGSSLELWISRLSKLNTPEFYLTDRDNRPPAKPRYENEVNSWNQREGCTAWITCKRELENYINPKAIKAEYPDFPESECGNFSSIPLLLARFCHEQSTSEVLWDSLTKEKQDSKISRAKRQLNTRCVSFMTPDWLSEIDPNNEVRNWLVSINEKLRTE